MKKPTGNRAWRRAAKKLRRKMGRKWRCSNEDRGHISGAWFKRHGFTELNLDAPHPVRVYIGRCDTAHGNGVEYVVKSQSFTARSLVGMTMGARKRAARVCPGCIECRHEIPEVDHGVRCDSSGAFERAPTVLRSKYRIGERLRPCPGCSVCARPCHYCEMQEPDDSRCPRCRQVMYSTPICDGSGVLPARKS